jgi:hypothetical protein
MEGGGDIGVLVAKRLPSDGQTLLVIAPRRRVVGQASRDGAETVETPGDIRVGVSEDSPLDPQRLFVVAPRPRVIP